MNRVEIKIHGTGYGCCPVSEAPAMGQFRFTVRRLMIAVAVVAVVLAAGLEAARLARISAARRRHAASCAASEALAQVCSPILSIGAGGTAGTGLPEIATCPECGRACTGGSGDAGAIKPSDVQ